MVKNIEKQIPAKMQLIKTEIYGSFTSIVKKTFVTVFNEYYGINYNIESLLNSISFNSGNGLIPDFSYDENKFVFNQELLDPDINDRYNKFNKNAGLTDEFVRFNDPRMGRNTARYRDKKISETMDEEYRMAKQTVEDYDNGNADISVDELNESLDFIDYLDNTRGKMANTMTRDEGYAGLKKVYQIARQRALEEWQYEFNVQLKPRFIQKYGINL